MCFPSAWLRIAATFGILTGSLLLTTGCDKGTAPPSTPTRAKYLTPSHGTSTPRVVVPRVVANVRNAPSTSGNVVRKVSVGEELIFLEKKEGWYRLDHSPSSEEQWIHESTVSERTSHSSESDPGRKHGEAGTASLSFFWEAYGGTPNSGANLVIKNSTQTSFQECTIRLGDGIRSDRWTLPKSTVFDAAGQRSYPTFLFRDANSLTPPTPTTTTSIEIECAEPKLTQLGTFSGSGATQSPKAEAVGAPPASSIDHDRGSSDDREALWIVKTESGVRARLKDPESAIFRRSRLGYVDGLPVVCGEVSSKNSLGGRPGYQRFVGSDSLIFLEEEVADFEAVWKLMCR